MPARVQALLGATKYHVIDTTAHGYMVPLSCCGAWLGGDADEAVPAHAVPEPDRCRKAACRRAWPAPLRLVAS